MPVESLVGKMDELALKLASSDEETRRSAVTGLAHLPFGEVKGHLFTALGDESWRVRKETVDVLLAMEIPDEGVEEIVDLLASENAGLRNSAVEALEKLGNRSVAPLCRHLDDVDHDVRKFVIDILGAIGNARAVPLLVKALDDREPNVCAAAAENLGKIGDEEAIPHLLRALAKSDIWLRYTILEALGKIGKPVPMAVVTPLVHENLLKKAVFDCLGAIGDAEAAPLLLEGIRDRVKNTREAAVIALMKVRGRLAQGGAALAMDDTLKGYSGAPFVEGLISSLDTSDRELQEALILLLGIIGDDRAAARLLRCFRDDRLRRQCLASFRSMGEKAAAALVRSYPDADDVERAFIIYICGELRCEGAVQLIREGLRDADPILRKTSVRAAGKSAIPGLIGEVAPLLDDADKEVRAGAVEALAQLAAENDEKVRRIAGELARAGLPEKRCNAAILFARLGDAEKLSLLVKDDDARVRRSAVHALAGLKQEASVGHLVMALVDEETDVRIAAAGALGEIGGEAVLEPLLLAMKDEDPWVQSAALASLGKVRHEGARPAIMELLATSAEGMVTISALNALARIGGEGVADLAKKALADHDEEVVKAAIDILSGQGDGWLDEYRERLLAHPHWDVRRSFIRAMADGRGAEAVPYLKAALDCEGDELVREQLLEIMDRYQ